MHLTDLPERDQLSLQETPAESMVSYLKLLLPGFYAWSALVRFFHFGE
ncbi:MAG: hypothetical protein AAF433_19175 [Bacteroidota bacterium]